MKKPEFLIRKKNNGKTTIQSFPVKILIPAILLLNACKPLQNLKDQPSTYKEVYYVDKNLPAYDVSKKTVFIVADNKLTELFDLLAPFYLFNTTEKANVYIIAKEKSPVLLKKGLYVLPQLTFREMDSLEMQADVIIIPALSARDEHQDPVVISWIKRHFSPTTKLLAICDGASTAAATGLYDGKPLTCHASDYAALKSHFSKPTWVQEVNVTQSDNLFSTAGVSNAVEGSLTVINELFGRETMQIVAANIHYPHTEIQTTHQSIALDGGTKFIIAKKLIFRKNRKLGLLLNDGVNEFEMASVIDTYGRSFPASFKIFMLNSSIARTKYGLTLVYTGEKDFSDLDELHLVMRGPLSKEDTALFKNARLIGYDNLEKQYPIESCLERIDSQYGHRFKNAVKILLDYN